MNVAGQIHHFPHLHRYCRIRITQCQGYQFHAERRNTIATTALIPLHTGKGRKISHAIRQIIGYVNNPNKTENGKYVTGYACDPLMADAQFAQAKAEYLRKTGRTRGSDDVIAYHLRQSFAPGEVTPEEANRLGQELARRFTKGQNAFVVSTHTDKAHIHNHIIISAVNLDCDRKFRNFWGSTMAIRRLSDTICLENGYSIVENPQPPDKTHGRKIWLAGKNPPTQRDNLREAIDIALARKPQDMEALILLLRGMGWEIKHGKHIAFRRQGETRFKRLDSLGEEYSEESLTAVMKTNQPHKAKMKKSIHQKQANRMAMLADIQRKMREKNSPAYTRWSKVFYAKQMANTLLYMSENNLDEADVFEQAATVSARCDDLTARIQATDKRMNEITALRQHIFNYSKTRDVYRAYCQCKPKDKARFAAEHQDELDRHQAAKTAFNALNSQKLPTVKELSTEFDSLKRQKGKLYAEYRIAKDEHAKLLTVKANLELILDRDPHEIEQEAQQHGR